MVTGSGFRAMSLRFASWSPPRLLFFFARGIVTSEVIETQRVFEIIL
jgi:hypothetical protein